MKTILILFLTILLSGKVFSKDNEETYKHITDEGGDSLEEKLLQDPDVKNIYESTCSREKLGPDSKLSVAECIYQNLGEDKAQEVMDKYFVEEQAEGKKAKLEKFDLDVSAIGHKSSPEMKKLEQYLSKRMGEGLYGKVLGDNKAKDKKAQVAEHNVFFEIYKRQLSKNLLSGVSTFCIEAKKVIQKDRYDSPYPIFVIPSDKDKRLENRKNNLKDLGKISDMDQPEASNKWLACLTQIPKICDGTLVVDDKDDRRVTKQRACLVTRLMKDIRENLIQTNKIQDLWKEREKAGGQAIQMQEDDGPRAVYEDRKKKGNKNIDELTSITSGEFAANTEYDPETIKEELSKCKTNPEDEVCKKYIYSQEEQKKISTEIDEYDLRSKLITEKLKKIDNEEDVKTLLKEEGRSDKEIEAIFDEAEKYAKSKNVSEAFEVIKRKVAEQYHNERTSIIANLRKQLKERSLPTDFEKDQEAIQAKINTIEEDLTTKADRYKSLIHFNNIVTGYLSVDAEDSEGKIIETEKSNIESAVRELQDNALSEESKTTAGAAIYSSQDDKQNLKKLQEHAQSQVKSESSDDSQDENSAQINVEQINETLLKYDFNP